MPLIIARRVAFSVYKFVFCVPEKKTPSKICPSTRRPCAQLWREKKITFDIGCVRRRRLRRSLLGEYLSSSSFMNRSFCLLRSDRRRSFLFPRSSKSIENHGRGLSFCFGPMGRRRFIGRQKKSKTGTFFSLRHSNARCQSKNIAGGEEFRPSLVGRASVWGGVRCAITLRSLALVNV